MIRKIPWHGYNWLEKKLTAVASAGTAFTDILMFSNLGFRESLLMATSVA